MAHFLHSLIRTAPSERRRRRVPVAAPPVGPHFLNHSSGCIGHNNGCVRRGPVTAATMVKQRHWLFNQATAMRAAAALFNVQLLTPQHHDQPDLSRRIH